MKIDLTGTKLLKFGCYRSRVPQLSNLNGAEQLKGGSRTFDDTNWIFIEEGYHIVKTFIRWFTIYLYFHELTCDHCDDYSTTRVLLHPPVIGDSAPQSSHFRLCFACFNFFLKRSFGDRILSVGG